MTDRNDVHVEIDGVSYDGWFEVKGGIVTVHTSYGRKTAQQGGTPPKVIAEMMLRELVRSEKKRKDPMI